ncbi:unnamed protein product, partial [Brassica napus]
EEEDEEEEEEEEEKKNKISTSMKSGSTSASVPVKQGNVHVKLELDALNIAVGQRYDTKDALETRLKIFARQATPEILARLYVDYVGGVDSKVLPKHVGEALNMRFGVKVRHLI